MNTYVAKGNIQKANKHLNRFSTSLSLKAKINHSEKPQWSYQFGYNQWGNKHKRSTEEMKSLSIAGGNVRQCNCYKKKYLVISPRTKPGIPWDPVIWLLGIFQTLKNTQNKMSTPVFIRAVCTTTRNYRPINNVSRW